jgi:hypothetical protein
MTKEKQGCEDFNLLTRIVKLEVQEQHNSAELEKEKEKRKALQVELKVFKKQVEEKWNKFGWIFKTKKRAFSLFIVGVIICDTFISTEWVWHKLIPFILKGIID